MSFYFLNSPEKLTKEQIGGKGFYLHQMAQDQLPIPEACFISTDLWKEYQKSPVKTSEKIKKEVIPAMIKYFKENNGGVMPLVSVRSAGAVSMPGMMDTILNVGVSPDFLSQTGSGEPAPETKKKTTKATKTTKKTKKENSFVDQYTQPTEAFVADTYARFLTMYGQTVLGINKDVFYKIKKFSKIEDVKPFFEGIYKKAKKDLPPEQVEDQLYHCILAVFDSWNNDRAKLYRKLNKIDESAGTAVVIQRMVFGNKNDLSATGVLFSRNPSNGKNLMTGEYLVNAQGEDVVSGSHTPKNMDEMEHEFPEAYKELENISKRLEAKYKQMQDIEFTIEDDRVFILQARTAKCSPFAKLKMLMDMYKLEEITAQDVLNGLSLQEYLDLNVKQVNTEEAGPEDGKGLPASMGAIAGRVVFGPSSKYKDDPIIYLAKETTPDDLEAIQGADGILTASGGVTSHAAVVARGMGKICIVGCESMKIDMGANVEKAVINGKTVKSGDWITMDATQGKVWVGKDAPIVDAQNSQLFWDLEDLAVGSQPGWIRVTSKVDELIKENQSYFLTYMLDDQPDDFVRTEISDALQYLSGTIDLTGKLDFLQQKYKNQFLFADISSSQVFLDKKRILLSLNREGMVGNKKDYAIYLGPYDKEHREDFEDAGFTVLKPQDVSFDGKTKAKIMVTQELSPASLKKEGVAVSSKNALLGILKP